MKITTLIWPLLFMTLASTSWASEGRDKRKMMKDLDTDGDGALTFQEFQKGPDRRFQKTDVNNDGVITLDEMQQHHAARKAERQSRASEKLGERFTLLDVDGDGFITLDEAQRGIFNHIDSNGDGLITRKEGRKAGKRRHRQSNQDEG